MLLDQDLLVILTIGVLTIALLYSSVGHAGASCYIAIMSLLNIIPAAIKPTSLVLNILVACIGAFHFSTAGHFSWRLFWPFAVLSVPMAFVGGYLTLPVRPFSVTVGIILLLSGAMFLVKPAERDVVGQPRRFVAIMLGGVIGLLSGLTGTGGGVFLTPLLLFQRWATAKVAAAVTSMFIMINSIAALGGNVSGTGKFPEFAFFLVIAAGIGGMLGSYLGSRQFHPVVIKRALALVLLVSGTRLILIP